MYYNECPFCGCNLDCDYCDTDFDVSSAKGDNDKFYKLMSFKRQTGIFTETVMMLMIR